MAKAKTEVTDNVDSDSKDTKAEEKTTAAPKKTKKEFTRYQFYLNKEKVKGELKQELQEIIGPMKSGWNYFSYPSDGPISQSQMISTLTDVGMIRAMCVGKVNKEVEG